jgi:hypothetical protein
VAASLINPVVASQGEMWTMLIQMIPSAEAIGQGDCEASKTIIGGRTFVTHVAFTHAAALLQRVRLSIGRSENEIWGFLAN